MTSTHHRLFPDPAAPGSPSDERPPIGAVPLPGAAEPFRRLRPTVHVRPHVAPRLWHPANDDGRFDPSDPYVRRYWTPLLGPGAVADLLRLATAARRGRSLPRPIHLSQLARVGLVRFHGAGVDVRARIPAVPTHHMGRLPPFLRRELARMQGSPGIEGH